MAYLYSKVETTKPIAIRLVKRSADVASAGKKRDTCLYKLLENLHELDKELRKIGMHDVLKALKAKYGDELPTSADSGMFALKLTCPSLAPKACSKYAAVLRLIRKKKKPGQSVRQFVHANGGINGCVKKEKELRDAKRA